MKDNLKYVAFLNKQRKIREAILERNKVNKEEEELKNFMKSVLPLMSVRDLVGCLIMKCCDDEGVKFTGLKYGENEYEVEIRRK